MTPLLGGVLLENVTATVDGVERSWHVYVPDALPPGHPVVVALHGGGSNADDQLDPTGVSPFKEWLEIADEEGLLVIVPNGTNGQTGRTEGGMLSWNDGRSDNSVVSEVDDIAFFHRLLDWTEVNFAVDPRQIYFTGSSNGGLMCYRVAREMSHRVAAIAPFIANSPANPLNDAPDFPISVFICNGSGEDHYMPWEGGFVVNDPSRGEVLSAAATRNLWEGLLKVDSPPTVTAIPNRELGEGSSAVRQYFSGGEDDTELMFVTVVNGGHVIPSRQHRYPDASLDSLGLGIQNHDFEGFREAWAFLKRQRLGATRSPSLSDWLSAQGFSHPQADPDGDGRTAVETYLAGSEASLLGISTGEDGFQLTTTLREIVNGATATVEYSDDLETWHQANGSLQLAGSVIGGNGDRTLTFRDPSATTAQTRYYRMAIRID